ncbi:divalent-cation tolerance protein CutA [Luteimonas vadosa]|uniref:Divalent-cation tolerance protein CutA n=1 Tax=Luteimonas vadosa TaxID=1165507 RepID=A0ABP9DTG8_9GAMM
MPPAPAVSLVYCTCPDAATASRLAEAVVEERLAACVNVLPGLRSVYRWRDAVEQADEILLLAKTGSDRVAALSARLAELHPYELPEVVAVQASGGSAAYLAWVADASRPGASPR